MKKLLLLTFLFAPFLVSAQFISTFAGTGIPGFSGDGGMATNAQFSQPGSIVTDAAGNVFVTDMVNHRVRKIDVYGTITTYAGNGNIGSSGDGGLAVNAEFFGICGLALDNAGNLCIADELNNRIRRVDANTGIITTIAGTGAAGFTGDGGHATASTLHWPGWITYDNSGNLYISDIGNSRIRKVNTSGIITTVVGNGIIGFYGDGMQGTAASLNQPHGLACDADNNLYIADEHNGRIRKLNTATGVMSTFAGNGTYVFNGDTISALAAAITPEGLKFDAAGNLYEADSANNSTGNRIREITTGGVIYTVAGNGIAGYNGENMHADSALLSGPTDMAFDPCGGLLISDMNNNRIRRVIYDSACYALSVGTIANSNLSIYPNPATNVLHIDGIITPATYTLFNAIGTQVQHGILKPGSNDLLIGILPEGLYLLQVTDDAGGRVVRKVMKMQL